MKSHTRIEAVGSGQLSQSITPSIPARGRYSTDQYLMSVPNCRVCRVEKGETTSALRMGACISLSSPSKTINGSENYNPRRIRRC